MHIWIIRPINKCWFSSYLSIKMRPYSFIIYCHRGTTTCNMGSATTNPRTYIPGIFRVYPGITRVPGTWGTVTYFTSKFNPDRLNRHQHLTHWGRAPHICVSKLTTIGSDNGLSPGRRQAIIWTIAGILLIGPLGTNLSEISIGIQLFSFKKMHLKMSSAKWRPFVSVSMCLLELSTWNRSQGVCRNQMIDQY